jgi:hypothetical protein
MKPKLKSPGTKCVKLKCGWTASNFCFEYILRRYNEDVAAAAVRELVAIGKIKLMDVATSAAGGAGEAGAYTRPLLSST